MPLPACLSLVLLALLLAPPCRAVTQRNTSVKMDGFANDFEDVTASGTGVALLDHETFFSGDPPRANFHGRGTALAAFGSQGIDAALTMGDYAGGYFSSSTIVEASSSILDTWTVKGRSGPGAVRLAVTLDGAMAAPNETVVVPYVVYIVNYASGNAINLHGTNANPAGSYLTDPIPFTFGEPFTVAFILYGGVMKTDPSDLADHGGVFAESEYGNTATATVAEVLDGQGQPVDDFVLETESGASYAAPEPARGTLLAAGASLLAALAGWTGRRPPRGSA